MNFDNATVKVSVPAAYNTFTGVTLTAKNYGALNFFIYGATNTATTAALTAADFSKLNYTMNSQNTITDNTLTSSNNSTLTYNMPRTQATDNVRVVVAKDIEQIEVNFPF